MPIDPTFSTLWAVNGPLELGELRRQLDEFVAAGLDGVVFHPRFYPDDPAYLGDEYLAVVSTLILDAAERGLAFWIYDENGWPSGTVGGRMLEQHPELRQRWVELQPDGAQPTLARFDRDGSPWVVVERLGDGVDYLSADLADRFVGLCYERYARGLDPAAFAHVTGFFSDEPEFGLGHAHHDLSPHGAIPWTPDLPARYAERHGRDLLADLPSIFATGPESAGARERFWDLTADLFAERYLACLDRWCRDHGVQFTAHVKGEEHPLFQLPTVGSLGAVVRAVGLPGVDALGRHPVNDFYPRQASGVARQFGDGRTMAEAFGGAGWGAAPADLEAYLRWLGSHGVTDFVLHLSQYRLDSAAIEDWPPSHPRHVSWSAIYAAVLDAVRAELRSRPRPPADVLVVVPQRAIARAFEPWEFVATNVHDAHDFPSTEAGRINAAFLRRVEQLHERGIAYEFTDERTLEREGRVDGGCLVLGVSRYRRVEVPPEAALDESALDDGVRVAWGSLTGSVEGVDGARRGAPAPAPPTPAAPHVDLVPVRWRLEREPSNELVIDPSPAPAPSPAAGSSASSSDGSWHAAVESLDFAGELELRFADEPAEVDWGGVALDVTRVGEVWRGRVRLGAGERREVRFRPRVAPPAPTVPRVWAAGVFRVRGARRTEHGDLASYAGPFGLAAPEVEPTWFDSDAVATGFPFLFEPLELVADVEVPPGAESLTLTGGLADAAGVRVGEAATVWRWGADASGWSVPLGEAALDSGRVLVHLTLLPSSFNRYGPHHHFAGDPAVVSPAQMQGARNYADVDGAPERTHVSSWWVRRLVLPDAVGFAVGEAPATPVLRHRESALTTRERRS